VGIQILANSEHGAVFYSPGTDWAFGPVMPDADVAEAFLRTFSRQDDPRLLEDAALEHRWHKFQERLHCPLGHNKANVMLFSNEVHISCMEKGCSYVWDLDGNLVQEEAEDEEAA